LANWPITDFGSQINTLATNQISQGLFTGQGNAQTVLTQLNSDINALFQ